ncbi:MAG: efflux RND transporter periplasmic adaptor subunit, partial [Desulfovibrionales bacterium]|nr:efflux RND transporter periplasmic adaptor subunit [Desulfovibrionales bacterium]
MEIKAFFRESQSLGFKILRVVIVLGIALAVALGLTLMGTKPQKSPPENPPPSVTVLAVTPQTLTMGIQAFGTIKPRKQVNLAAEISGRILWVHPNFTAGGAVSRDQVLIRMDPRTHELSHRSAKVRVIQARTDIQNLEQEIVNLQKEIALARAAVKLSRREMERTRALKNQQFASGALLDQMEQRHLNARIQLQSLENRLSLTPSQLARKRASLSMAQVEADKAALTLSKTQIASSFDGWVLEKAIEVGEFVSPGQSLGRLYEKGKLDLEVSIPAEQVHWLKTGGVTGGRANGLTARVWAVSQTAKGDSNAPSSGVKARVSHIEAALDDRTRTLGVVLELEASDTPPSLKPGTFVTCRIQGSRAERVFVLPRHLLTPD